MSKYNELLGLLFEKFKQTCLDESKREFVNHADSEILSVLLKLRKSEKDFRKLFEISSVSESELIIYFGDKLLIEDALSEGLIRNNNTLQHNCYSISLIGIHRFLVTTYENYNFENVLKSIEYYRLPENKLSLNTSEKLLSIFLVVVGADCYENAFKIKSPSFDKQCLEFMKRLDECCFELEIDLGKRITFHQGKNKSFIGLLGNNVQLPKTMIFNGNANQGYYLDFMNVLNISLLIDLVVEESNELEKYKKKQKIVKLILRMKQLIFEILQEATPEISDKFMLALMD